MQITLRDYQQKYVNRIRESFQQGKKRLLCVAPTGAGKTIIFSFIACNSAEKGNRSLVITDRIEILTQTGNAFESFGVEPYLITAKQKELPAPKQAFVGMSQTLRNRMKKENWRQWLKNEIDIIIIDEAHVQEFDWIFELKNEIKNKYILGFTATAGRQGSMTQMGNLYTGGIIEVETTKSLIDKGYLCPAVELSASGGQTNNVGVNSATGDFKTNELFAQFDKTKLYAGVVENWTKYVQNKKTIVYCVNKTHAIKTAIEFEKHGIKVKYLVSKTSPPKPLSENSSDVENSKFYLKQKDFELYGDTNERLSGCRDEILKGFRSGNFDVLINVDILTKGFDCPEVDAIVVNRATLSKMLWVQMIGRGARTSAGKSEFFILDFGENIERHGGFDDPHEWGLWHKQSAGGGVPPMKPCGYSVISGEELKGKKILNGEAVEVLGGCGDDIPASSMVCPLCGYMYIKNDRKEFAKKLVPNYPTPPTWIQKLTISGIINAQKTKKYKDAWVYRMICDRGGIAAIEQVASEFEWDETKKKRALRYARWFEKEYLITKKQI